MRSMDYIGISQTIGRVIRKGNADKVFGLVCIPVYSNVGISTARKVEAVVDTIFNKGEDGNISCKHMKTDTLLRIYKVVKVKPKPKYPPYANIIIHTFG